MPNVVFTGRGYLPNGDFVERYRWEDYARGLGWNVQDVVAFATDYLVSSRDDTKKAKAAIHLGVEVISYRDFYSRCGPVPAPRPSAPEPAPDRPYNVVYDASSGKFMVAGPNAFLRTFSAEALVNWVNTMRQQRRSAVINWSAEARDAICDALVPKPTPKPTILNPGRRVIDLDGD